MFSFLEKPNPAREAGIENFMWESEDKLNLYMADEIKAALTPDEIRYFCWKHGIYQLPTRELIHWLQKNIVFPAIEIGAGGGHIGKLLGIPMTDSKLQEEPSIIKLYEEANQPVIKYGKLVEKIEAFDAVVKYQPKTVLGCWVTERERNPNGVLENFIMGAYCVDQYIIVGNSAIHSDKPILNEIDQFGNRAYPLQAVYEADARGESWLISRAAEPERNMIWVVGKLAF